MKAEGSNFALDCNWIATLQIKRFPTTYICMYVPKNIFRFAEKDNIKQTVLSVYVFIVFI
jgi:hypothetical protein